MLLTNKQREAIINACIKARFADAEQSYQDVRTRLGDALYASQWGQYEKQADKMPEGWLETTGAVRIEMAGFSYRSEDKDKPLDSLAMSKRRRIPYAARSYYTIKCPAGHPCHDLALSVLHTFEKLKADKAELESSLRGILWASTTLAKLKECWPEGEPYFPVEQPKQTALVPYDLALKVNKIMGIKPKKAK